MVFLLNYIPRSHEICYRFRWLSRYLSVWLTRAACFVPTTSIWDLLVHTGRGRELNFFCAASPWRGRSSLLVTIYWLELTIYLPLPLRGWKMEFFIFPGMKYTKQDVMNMWHYLWHRIIFYNLCQLIRKYHDQWSKIFRKYCLVRLNTEICI